MCGGGLSCILKSRLSLSAQNRLEMSSFSKDLLKNGQVRLKHRTVDLTN